MVIFHIIRPLYKKRDANVTTILLDTLFSHIIKKKKIYNVLGRFIDANKWVLIISPDP